MNAKLIFNDIKEFMTIIDWLSTYNDERQNLFLIVLKKMTFMAIGNVPLVKYLSFISF
jgi:hypothetical protein